MRSRSPPAEPPPRPSPSRPPPVRRRSSTAQASGRPSIVEASYININGFTVVGDAANYNLASATAGYGTGNPDLDGNGIYVVSGSNGSVPNHVTISNNTVYNEPGNGICTGGADYVQVLNNVVHNNGNWSEYGCSGISIWTSANSDTAAGTHMVISGNTVYDNAQLVPTNGAGVIEDGEGIILDTNPNFVGQMLVQNNTVYGNGSSGIEFVSHAQCGDFRQYGLWKRRQQYPGGKRRPNLHKPVQQQHRHQQQYDRHPAARPWRFRQSAQAPSTRTNPSR